MSYQSYKYRLYPNKGQIEVLNKNLDFCCELYNCALQERISFYKRYGKGLSYASQCKALPEIKEMWFAKQTEFIYSQSLQQVLKRLDAAYQLFFQRVKEKADKVGFPRYKSRDRYRSIVFPQSDLHGFGVKMLGNQKLKVFGLPGELKVNWHRPFQGRCKQVLIKKQADKFYLILLCDEVPKEPRAFTGKTIAIDLGITTFITADDGTEFHHPKPYKTSKEKLAYCQKKLAAKQRGSNNREQAKLRLAKQYQKVSNIRDNFLHQTARSLIKQNDVVIIEKLNVKKMLEAKGFEVSKSNIQDASWGSFAAHLSYKAERAGKILIEVDPKNTSKMCSFCRNVKDNLTLRDRIYNCESCGLAMSRDLNAAINIRKLGELSPSFPRFGMNLATTS